VQLRLLTGTVGIVGDGWFTVTSGQHAISVTLPSGTPVFDTGNADTSLASGQRVQVMDRAFAGTNTALGVLVVAATADATDVPVTQTPESQPTTQPQPSPTESHGQITSYQGVITALDGSSLTLQTGDGQTLTFPLGTQVRVRTASGYGSLDQVHVGDNVSIYVQASDGGSAVVIFIRDNGSGDPTAVPATETPEAQPTTEPQASATVSYGPTSSYQGTITALDGSSLTLQNGDGDSLIFPLAAHISIEIGSSWATLDQVKVGVTATVVVRSINGAPPAVVGILV
jgi:hypothetical protein